MKLKELLKQGIMDGDWDTLCGVYKMVTGEELPRPLPHEIVKSDDDLFIEAFDGDADIVMPLEPEVLFGASPQVVKPREDLPLVDDAQEALRESIKKQAEEAPEVDEEDEFAIQHGKSPLNKTSWLSIVRDRPTEFVDEGAAVPVDDVDRKFMEAHAQKQPERQQARPSSSKINVKCSKCGKEEEVSPNDARGYRQNPDDNTYKCQGCTLSGRPSRRG